MELKDGNGKHPFRLKIRLATGDELEAEGAPQFIEKERQAFLSRVYSAQTYPHQEDRNGIDNNENFNSKKVIQAPNKEYLDLSQTPVPSWHSIAHLKSGIVKLKAKWKELETPTEAAVVLMAAREVLLAEKNVRAGDLAKSLRKSGYSIVRMDRHLVHALERNEILASGTRRARTYELTSAGKLRAQLLLQDILHSIR